MILFSICMSILHIGIARDSYTKKEIKKTKEKQLKTVYVIAVI